MTTHEVAVNDTLEADVISPLARTVVAAQRGDVGSFESLVSQLGPVVYRFLVVRLGDEHDARDALQETLIAAWQTLPKLRRPDSVRAWLLTIAVRKAAAAARTRPWLVNTEVPEVSSPDSSDLIELDAALSALPSQMRDVVLLRYLIGLSEEETARALSVRVGTVKSRAARAREQIASFLERGDDEEAVGNGR